eukprot:TRINITY_DN31539_c0_g1_i1.p1 TRINITY_DN31539_c0_g1~~TRINITY_DN31539_c0_g1_i1.p1  ORF type:complete len:234 (-),score=48.35 TRINITY_DN31539_c0_g1_i1:183-884(-)
MIWPRDEIATFLAELEDVKAVCRAEQQALIQVKQELQGNTDEILRMKERVQEKTDDFTQPLNFWDVVTLGVTRIVDGVQLYNEVASDFDLFSDMYKAMKERLENCIRILRTVQQELIELWQSLLDLGCALAEFAGITLPEGFDDLDLSDLVFDSSTKAFLEPFEQKLLNCQCPQSTSLGLQKHVAAALEDMRLCARVRCRQLTHRRTQVEEESPASRDDSDEEGSVLLSRDEP